MLLSIATDKDGNLRAYEAHDAEELIRELKLKVPAKKLQALRKSCSSETEVVERIVVDAYPNNPALVEYDEIDNCIRVRIFSV